MPPLTAQKMGFTCKKWVFRIWLTHTLYPDFVPPNVPPNVPPTAFLGKKNGTQP